jgi:hypothetical protein
MELGIILFHTMREFGTKFRKFISAVKEMERYALAITLRFATYIGVLVISR